MIRQSLAFIAAASLAAAPTLAQPSASALSIAPSMARAGPAEADSDLEGASLFPVLVAAAIVVAGILLATGVLFDDDDSPSSP